MCTLSRNGNESKYVAADSRTGRDWASNGGDDSHTMNGGYVEHMNHHGYFPNYCYGPYPAPPPSFARYDPVFMGMQPMYMPMMGVSYFVPSAHIDQYAARHYYEHSSPPDPAMSRASRTSRTARRRMHESEDRSIDHKPSRGAQAAVLADKQENVDPPVPSAAGQVLTSGFLFDVLLTGSSFHSLKCTPQILHY
jgi:hypothetical protein